MKKLLLPLMALLLSVNVAFAQDDAPASPWTHGGNVGFNIPAGLGEAETVCLRV